MAFRVITRSTMVVLVALSFACEPQRLADPGPADGGGSPAQAVAVQARVIEPLELGVTNPAGLAFSPSAGLFFVLPRGLDAPSETETALELMTLAPDLAGIVRLGTGVSNPVNLAFDARTNRLLVLDAERQELVAIPASPDGRLNPERMVRLDLARAGLGAPQGLTVDPASGRLFVLDAAGPRIVRLEPDGGPVVSEIDLAPLGAATLRGIAFDPTTRHLHVFDPQAHVLYEVTERGDVLATRDLSAFELRDPQGMTFGPSGDTTDDAAELSLYVADRGEPTGALEARGFAETGKIIELSLLAPTAAARGALRPSFAAAPMVTGALIGTIETSQFNPASPDPAGISYVSHTGRLLISDSEVNEMSIFRGANLFDMTLSGNLFGTGTTTSFSDEPTGLGYNPSNKHLFISDDTGTRSVYEWEPGQDGLYGTGDDAVTSFRTAPFGSQDPEGVTYDPVQRVLYVVDGVNREVYRVAPGNNGRFDGVPPAGDDQVTSFDTQAQGLEDPEGIAFDTDYGHLYVVGKPASLVFHFTTSGTLLRTIDFSAANARKPAGLAYAPSSGNPSVMSLWIVDRGVDNDSNPNENDGKLYEVSVPPLSGGGGGGGGTNSAPTASNVVITGTVQLGQVLTGGYTYSDADGDLEGPSTFRWLRNGTAIDGAAAQSYTLVADDQGTEIRFEVTPVAQTGMSPGAPVQSPGVFPPAPVGTVTVTAITPNIVPAGSSLSVTITGTGFLSGATLIFENGSGPAPTASNVVVDNATTIRATISAKTNGPSRDRVWSVRVTNPNGSTGVLVGGLTVRP